MAKKKRPTLKPKRKNRADLTGRNLTKTRRDILTLQTQRAADLSRIADLERVVGDQARRIVALETLPEQP